VILKTVITIFSVLILLWPAISLGTTGNDWNGLSKFEKSIYVAGVVEGWTQGWVSEKQLHPQGGTLTKLVDCISDGMTTAQINALVEKFMKEHPEHWNMPMSVIVFLSMAKVCGVPTFQPQR
jgi:hypothetical protein